MTASESMPASRRWALRLVLLSLPLLALGAVEVSARVFFHFKYGVPGHRYGMSKYDPVLGAAPRELSYSQTAHLNDYAFRNSENVFQPKPAGSLRLITYGGSTVFCHDLRNDESWSIRLQELLRSRRPGGERDQVLNGGVVAWSLGHSFERARRDIPTLQPDVVIIYSGVNEESNAAYLEREGTPMKDLVERGEYGRFTKNLATATPLRDVLLYKFMRDRVFVQLQRAFNAPSTAPVDTTPDPAIMTTIWRPSGSSSRTSGTTVSRRSSSRRSTTIRTRPFRRRSAGSATRRRPQRWWKAGARCWWIRQTRSWRPQPKGGSCSCPLVST